MRLLCVLALCCLFSGCTLLSREKELAGVYLAVPTQESEGTKLVTVTLNPDRSVELVSKSEDGTSTEVQNGEWESDGAHVITVRLNDGENRPLHRSIVFRVDEAGLTPLILDRNTYGSGDVRLQKEGAVL